MIFQWIRRLPNPPPSATKSASEAAAPEPAPIKRQRRLLVVGFSCTAVTEGFTKYLKEKLAETDPDLDVKLCGFGGLAPPVVSTAMDRMFKQQGPFTHVIMEIATSIYALNTQDTIEAAQDLVDECVERVVKAGAKPAFLLLYRKGFENPKLRFNDVLRQRAEEFGYPVVDLAEGAIKQRGMEFIHSLLVDDVHTNAAGSEFHAEKAIEQLKDWLTDSTAPQRTRAANQRRNSMATSPFSKTVGVFEKQDYKLEYSLIPEGKSLTIAPLYPIRLFALTFLYGPKTGNIKITTDTGRPFTLQAYDDTSYYRRMGMRNVGAPMKGRLIRQITFEQLPGIPDVKLRKGVVDPSPREGQIVDLHFYTPGGIW